MTYTSRKRRYGKCIHLVPITWVFENNFYKILPNIIECPPSNIFFLILDYKTVSLKSQNTNNSMKCNKIVKIIEANLNYLHVPFIFLDFKVFSYRE